jgi:hypothetical protein
VTCPLAIVGTQLQVHHPADRIALGRQHDDGRAARAPDVAAQIQAVPIGQHQVQQDDVKGPLRQLPVHLGCRRRHRHLHAKAREVVVQQLADLGILLDQETSNGHARTSQKNASEEALGVVSDQPKWQM